MRKVKGKYERLNNGSPKDTYILIPGTCEYYHIWGKKYFADMVKLASEDGRVSLIIQVLPKANKMYKKKWGKKKKKKQTKKKKKKKREGNKSTEADTEVLQSQAKVRGSHWNLEKAKKRFDPKAFRESVALSKPSFQPSETDFRLLTSKTVRK